MNFGHSAGAVVTESPYEQEYLMVLERGIVHVMTAERMIEILHGPVTISLEANVEHVVFVITDAVWATVH